MKWILPLSFLLLLTPLRAQQKQSPIEHIHGVGHVHIVTAGCGWVQSESGPKEEIRPGDVVRCPPGEEHWHGATSTRAMTHIAIVEKLDGKTVDWMERVSDEQYQA